MWDADWGITIVAPEGISGKLTELCSKQIRQMLEPVSEMTLHCLKYGWVDHMLWWHLWTTRCLLNMGTERALPSGFRRRVQLRNMCWPRKWRSPLHSKCRCISVIRYFWRAACEKGYTVQLVMMAWSGRTEGTHIGGTKICSRSSCFTIAREGTVMSFASTNDCMLSSRTISLMLWLTLMRRQRMSEVKWWPGKLLSAVMKRMELYGTLHFLCTAHCPVVEKIYTH